MHAHWRSLNQDVPTSDVLCRYPGTLSRLQGCSPLPPCALLVLRQGDPHTPGLPEEPGPPRALPVKGVRPNDPGRLPSYRDILTCFRHEDPVTALVWEDSRAHSRTASPSLGYRRPCQYLRANPLSVNGDSTRARSCPSDRLATHQGARSRCVRSMSATQHSTNEHPYSPAPGSSSGLATCVHRMGCAHSDRGFERFTTPESLRRVARSRRGLFSPSRRPRIRFRFLRRPTSDTPVAPPALGSHAVFAALRTSEGRQGRFHPEHRDAPEAFPTQSAFPRQAIRDSLRPFQVADPGASSASRRCASRFRLSASLHSRRSPGALAGASRLPLVRSRDAHAARMHSREDCQT